ncbi:HAD family hydrolase [Alteromonas mediterranea]|uniref:HAD family hydrolase n=1 Tax=Alteromonas mediterranea TaxID=314275 RepID=UPI0012F95D78|nr:HAD-IA family hydrolase [Alteromonas mediterranea]QGX60435.1 HAD-IA family hydrolase [Alteromonas mediterranea]
MNIKQVDLTGVKGVIFDLDGTLVESSLNFTKMRDDVGCPHDQDILTFVDALSCVRTKADAHNAILRHELEDAQNAKWLEIGKAMVEKVQAHNLPMAIVTRNCRQATAIKVANNGIPIDYVLTREDAPAKPDPTALLMVANTWQLQPEDCLYVGDFIYDQQAAENAGMKWFLV